MENYLLNIQQLSVCKWLSATIKIVLFFTIGFIYLCCQTVEANTYYISPTAGSDKNPGTSQNGPWGTFTHAVSQLKPGDTLLLMDGTYLQTLKVSVSGNTDLPITIRALNDGKAIIDGQGARETVLVTGSSSNYAHDIVLEGIVASNSIKHVYKLKYVRNVILRRLSGKNAVNLDGNYHVFSFDRCEDILVEDCAAYGTGRILYDYYSGLRGTFRRCWGRWKDSRYSSVRTALAIYGSGDCIVENCVMTIEPNVQLGVEGIKINRRDGNPYGSRNKIYGNVVYGYKSDGSTGFMTQGNEIIDDNEWTNNVSIGNHIGCYQRNDRNLKVNKITIAESLDKGFSQVPYVKNKPAIECSWRLNADIRNTSIISSPVGISQNKSPIMLPQNCSGGSYYGEMTHSWNNLFQNDENYSGTSKDLSETSINPQYETTVYGKGAYLIIPEALKGKGEGGRDIGAEVIYRYVDGQKTSQLLWPWPMEDRILSETGVSVTFEKQGGIWKTLPQSEDLPNPPEGLRLE